MKREERKHKCIYCEDNKQAEHFICVDCGCGMCDDCYNDMVEHDDHCFDYHESIEDDDFYEYITKKTQTEYGYMCFECINERQKEFDKLKGGKK